MKRMMIILALLATTSVASAEVYTHPWLVKNMAVIAMYNSICEELPLKFQQIAGEVILNIPPTLANRATEEVRSEVGSTGTIKWCNIKKSTVEYAVEKMRRSN